MVDDLADHCVDDAFLQALRSLVEHQHEGLEDGAMPVVAVVPVAARSGHHPVNDLSGSQPLEEHCKCHEAGTGSEIVMAFCGLVISGAGESCSLDG